MKTNRLKSAFALIALCTTVNLHAENKAPPRRFPGERPLSEVTAKVAVNGDLVTVGTSRIMVSARLGGPNFVLRDGSWLYSDYIAQHEGKELGRPGTLVVRFAANKVSSLTIADQATTVALRQMPKRLGNEQRFATDDQPR